MLQKESTFNYASEILIIDIYIEIVKNGVFSAAIVLKDMAINCFIVLNERTI